MLSIGDGLQLQLKSNLFKPISLMPNFQVAVIHGKEFVHTKKTTQLVLWSLISFVMIGFGR